MPWRPTGPCQKPASWPEPPLRDRAPPCRKARWDQGGRAKAAGAAWFAVAVAADLGVLLLVAGTSRGWTHHAGWWLAGLGLGSFVPSAAAALTWRVVEDTEPG